MSIWSSVDPPVATGEVDVATSMLAYRIRLSIENQGQFAVVELTVPQAKQLFVNLAKAIRKTQKEAHT